MTLNKNNLIALLIVWGGCFAIQRLPLACASIALPSDFSVTATKFDFEGVAAGTNVRDFFASNGVLYYDRWHPIDDGDPMQPFSGEGAITSTNRYVTGHMSAVRGPSRVIVTTTTDFYGSNSGTIGAVFVDPINGNLATTASVGAYFYTHQEHPHAFMQLDAFDLGGNLLESLRIVGEGGSNVFLGLTRPEGIHRVEFFTGYTERERQGDGFNLDDFVFESLLDSGLAGPPTIPSGFVPEPVPLLIWGGFGIVGIVASWRRHRSARGTAKFR